MATTSDARGAQWLRWAPPIAVAAGILAAGHPAGVTPRGWVVAAIFAATIVSFITRPMAMAPMVLLGLVVLLLSGVFGHDVNNDGVIADNELRGAAAVESLLAGYSDAIVWLVVAAFLLSGTVVRTGLGRRIALVLITRLGRTTLGLGYAISGAELVLGPVIPSVTARGGGVMAPIINSLSQALGSAPDSLRRRTGGYLVLVGAHTNLITAAMFFTGMAANPQLTSAAADVFGEIHLAGSTEPFQWDWIRWLQGSWLPALLSLALVPSFLYLVSPPDVTLAAAARDEAEAELRAMGPWTGRQIALAALLLAGIAGWATEPFHGVYSTGVALILIAAICVLRIDEWTNFTADRAGWDALIWLGGLMAMAEEMKSNGVIDWFSSHVQGWVAGYSGVAAAIILALVYFFSMYGFSMLTGHLVALAGGFFVVGHAAEAPPVLLIALIAYFSNLCGCLTNYSTGPVVIYFGLGYVTPQRWFAVGFAMALFHITIWLGVGLPYWKMLGWW
jgi:DASS family divalent anion:Na+ symporter